VAVNATRFTAELRKFTVIGIDSVALIYHLEDTEPYSELTEVVFGAIAAGTPRAMISTVSVAEVLVKPFAAGRTDRVDAFERFLLALPNSVCLAPDYETAKDAARLRARYGLRMPDALLVATARRHGGQAFLTNDAELRKLRSEGLSIIVLDDYLS
jgi:predicted nucleic acid-binding protein